MKFRSAQNLILLALVLGLSLFIYLKPKQSGQALLPISDLSSTAIQQIKIEKKGQPTLEFKKRGNTWFVATPFQARGDNNKIEQILSILSARSNQQIVATQLDRFELDQPLLTLTLNQEVFKFGTINPLTRQQYVLSGNKVFLIPTNYFATAFSQPADFISKKLLAEDETPTSFRFAQFKLDRQNGQWIMTPPNPNMDQDQFNRFADDWRMASALHSQPYDKSKPISEYTLHFQNGKSVKFQVLQQQHEFILLRTDENIQFHFSQDTAKRLLTP
ncbi:DUF4340 domain-containing protein [Sulfurirhabdus autotrophica]|uniref:Uncharacterized protein DUF4340 n=1 Tax=Sulfurirhabdus autotrophica TaxID=1706046 RepID=A0A4R3Y203_9PROT|nr:DUF4340 domain-containing protein [Sulfurirhabdus autotrophica]TCV84728.1 uncharacterized protein DUF4340 [Sulfurirhabdus autotrophica]